jgi:hypothetical protein
MILLFNARALGTRAEAPTSFSGAAMKLYARCSGFVKPIVLLAIALGFTASAARPVAAADDPNAEKRKAAVEKGLKALSEQVRAERKAPQGGEAVHAFAGLAFLASGSTSDDGPYAQDVRSTVDQILHAADAKTGYIAAKDQGTMYEHGFATLFLAEAYAGQRPGERKDEIGKALNRAVELIARSQTAEGGWRYRPEPKDADVSVTASQTVALAAAQRAGIKLPDRTLDRALAYLRKCQNEDGGFRYMAGSKSASGFPRSAAAAAALAHVDGVGKEDVRRAIKYLTEGIARSGTEDGHFFYGRYYAGQLLGLTGDASREGYAALCDDLLKRQNADGSWRGDFSDVYATATALIALQATDGKLLIMQPVGEKK